MVWEVLVSLLSWMLWRRQLLLVGGAGGGRDGRGAAQKFRRL